MAYIYKITNLINNKVYIGQTSFSLSKRWQEHIKDSERFDRPLYRAFHKYGIENFNIELIEETDSPNEREVYWIKSYNAFHNGYNATMGGEGRPYDFTAKELETIITMYNKNYSVNDIAVTIGHDRDTVLHKMQDLGLDVSNHRTLKMAVYQLDKKTDQIIKSYPSTHDAARALGDDRKNAHIRECCRGLRKSAYGYKWRFIEDIAEK